MKRSRTLSRTLVINIAYFATMVIIGLVVGEVWKMASRPDFVQTTNLATGETITLEPRPVQEPDEYLLAQIGTKWLYRVYGNQEGGLQEFNFISLEGKDKGKTVAIFLDLNFRPQAIQDQIDMRLKLWGQPAPEDTVIYASYAAPITQYKGDRSSDITNFLYPKVAGR